MPEPKAKAKVEVAQDEQTVDQVVLTAAENVVLESKQAVIEEAYVDSVMRDEVVTDVLFIMLKGYSRPVTIQPFVVRRALRVPVLMGYHVAALEGSTLEWSNAFVVQKGEEFDNYEGEAVVAEFSGVVFHDKALKVNRKRFNELRFALAPLADRDRHGAEAQVVYDPKAEQLAASGQLLNTSVMSSVGEI